MHTRATSCCINIGDCVHPLQRLSRGWFCKRLTRTFAPSGISLPPTQKAQQLRQRLQRPARIALRPAQIAEQGIDIPQ